MDLGATDHRVRLVVVVFHERPVHAPRLEPGEVQGGVADRPQAVGPAGLPEPQGCLAAFQPGHGRARLSPARLAQRGRGVVRVDQALAAHRQVVCITHLPQIAARAGRHFSIEKDVSVEPAGTTVRTLDDGELVGELVRMLGAPDDDAAARDHAAELLRAA